MYVGFNTRFNEDLKLAKPWWSKIATMFPSTGESETYAWETVVPQMRQWIGSRQYANLKSRDFTLVNRTFELSLEVPRERVEDDKYGIFATPRLTNMAKSVAKWPDALIAPLLLNGQSLPTFDGQNFFSASHPVDQDDPASATQSNYYASGKALTPTNYGEVRNNMMALVDVNGLPLSIMPDTLIVPPQLADVGKKILEADTIANAAGTASESNIQKGTADLLVIPELVSQPTAWYVACLGDGIKPFIFQQRRAPEFVAMDRADSENVFALNVFRYGASARGEAGFGLFYKIAKAQA
ncbi:Mu-like prophage major head subunit gpT family protein [Sorangium sp. So ce1389]|uniref:Mu-like prophage major head subunit gpT family protein n=1 Tax=Sorangium sp. So ce1389 TaxID=3133336 RepID=UPI003F640757